MRKDAVKEKIVRLAFGQTCVPVPEQKRKLAISVAYRATLSSHEHKWTPEEQLAMADYVLWAYQRLCAIDQCVNGEVNNER